MKRPTGGRFVVPTGRRFVLEIDGLELSAIILAHQKMEDFYIGRGEDEAAERRRQRIKELKNLRRIKP